MNERIFVQITTWAGISIGADHYYVKIYYYDMDKNLQIKRLEDTLTAHHAKLLNKRELNKAEGYRYNYKKGDKTDGFWTLKEAKEKAVEWVDETFLENKIILTGSSCGGASVEECLKHPDIVKKDKINILWKKAESIGYYYNPKNDNFMEKIDSEFSKLIKIK